MYFNLCTLVSSLFADGSYLPIAPWVGLIWCKSKELYTTYSSQTIAPSSSTTLLTYMMMVLNHIIIIIILIHSSLANTFFLLQKVKSKEETLARFPCKCLNYRRI